MPFTKGKPKTGGRQPGTPNTVGKELRERVKELVESRFNHMEAKLRDLDPKEQIAVLLKLMEFVLPKAHQVQVQEVEKDLPINFDHLSMEKMLLLHSLLNEAKQPHVNGIERTQHEIPK